MFQFKRMTKDDLPQVLAWRTSPHVTKFMNTDIVPDIEQQRRWFAKLDPVYYWIISVDEKPIGVINLSDLDLRNQRTSFGFYIGEREYWNIGGFVLRRFYNYVFDNFPINKIMAEVFAENKNIIKIHELHGFREVGIFYDHIYKNECYHDVVVMELYRYQWEDHKWFGDENGLK